MAKYFTLAELTRSDTAKAHGVDNTPGAEEETSLLRLMDSLLDPIREAYGAPLTVNSGFRSERTNTLVGGAKSSQHVRGEAADITAGSPVKNKELFDLIISRDLDFDQLIDEKGYRWLHVSLKASGNRKQILHL